MNTPEPTSKVYLKIVEQLRGMINEDHLQPGDKLPSERELSERLNAGRSSVREALRALELLGLIETRRGEGTFIRDFKGHQLIPLLSTFILQDDKSKRDVKETKYIIEKECLSLIIERAEPIEIVKLQRWVEEKPISDDDFFVKLVELSDNFLLWRIWTILSDYYHSLGLKMQKPPKELYLQLLQALSSHDVKKVFAVYKKLRGMSKET